MRKYVFYFWIVFFLMSCRNKDSPALENFDIVDGKYVYSNFEESKKIPLNKLYIEPYEGDTILTNGYNLTYKITKSSSDSSFLQSLILMKNGKEIKKLNEIAFPLPQKNLGFVNGDFDKYFLFIQSFGTGNPRELQIIEKSSGNSIENGVFVDLNPNKKILLFIKNENDQNQQLILKDFKNGKETIITDFDNIQCKNIGGLRNCVELDSVTYDFVILKANDGERKKYHR